MNPIKLITLALLGLFLSVPAWAQKYGDADIQQGKIIVLRTGKRLSFKQGAPPVQINHNDVIRVGRESKMVLATNEKATITLGSNAVFQVKPWEKNKKRGLFRMLFGRMRAKIAQLSGTERFNVSSATATIGVKGTEYTGAFSATGDAWVVVVESIVQLAGQDAIDQDVLENFISVVVGNNPSSPPAPPPPELLQDVQQDQLDSPAPNSPEAVLLPFVEALVEAGLISEVQAEEILEEDAENISELLETITEAVEDSANEASGAIAPISVEFEK